MHCYEVAIASQSARYTRLTTSNQTVFDKYTLGNSSISAPRQYFNCILIIFFVKRTFTFLDNTITDDDRYLLLHCSSTALLLQY